MFDVLLYGLLATALWVLVPRRRLATLGVVGVVVVADQIGLIPGAFRYLLGVDVVLAYLAASRVSRLKPGIALLVASTLTLAIVFELPQLLYAVPALGVVWFADVAVERPRTWSDLRNALQTPTVFAATGVAIMLVLIGLLDLTGQLRGVAQLYARAADQVDYSTWPTPISHLGWRLLDLQLTCCGGRLRRQHWASTSACQQPRPTQDFAAAP